MSDLFEESYSSQELDSSDESILSDNYFDEKKKFFITWNDLTFEFKKKVINGCFFNSEASFLNYNKLEEEPITSCNFRINQFTSELWREVDKDKWIFKENNDIILEKTAIVGEQVFFKIYSNKGDEVIQEHDFSINNMTSIKEAFDLAENKVHDID